MRWSAFSTLKGSKPLRLCRFFADGTYRDLAELFGKRAAGILHNMGTSNPRRKEMSLNPSTLPDIFIPKTEGSTLVLFQIRNCGF